MRIRRVVPNINNNPNVFQIRFLLIYWFHWIIPWHHHARTLQYNFFHNLIILWCTNNKPVQNFNPNLSKFSYVLCFYFETVVFQPPKMGTFYMSWNLRNDSHSIRKFSSSFLCFFNHCFFFQTILTKSPSFFLHLFFLIIPVNCGQTHKKKSVVERRS